MQILKFTKDLGLDDLDVQESGCLGVFSQQQRYFAWHSFMETAVVSVHSFNRKQQWISLQLAEQQAPIKTP